MSQLRCVDGPCRGEHVPAVSGARTVSVPHPVTGRAERYVVVRSGSGVRELFWEPLVTDDAGVMWDVDTSPLPSPPMAIGSGEQPEATGWRVGFVASTGERASIDVQAFPADTAELSALLKRSRE